MFKKLQQEQVFFNKKLANDDVGGDVNWANVKFIAAMINKLEPNYDKLL